jgi:hypothetical protein
MESDCRYFDILEYNKILQERYKKKIIDQMSLIELFENN